MPNWVNGEGPSNAELMIVAEAPGGHEDEEKRPLIGPTGRLVEEILSEIGISRRSVYLTNVVKIRPPSNDITRLNEYGKSIADFEPHLWNEINAIKPNCILALGNVALKTLTGKDKITNWRGSILQSKQGFPKVVPTIHPANLIEHRGEATHKWRDKAFITLDFERAVKQSKFKDFDLPRRQLWVCRSSYQLYEFIKRYEHKDKLSVDIETFRAIPICIGLAFSKDEAISIPLLDIQDATNMEGIGLNDAAHIWKAVAELLYDERIKKIGQNYKFDERVLATYEFPTRWLYSDTMLKFHCLYPEFSKSLEFQTSILTEEPFYKNEYRDYNPKKDDFKQILLYNAKDAAVTYEIDDVLEQELIEEGLYEYYYDFYIKNHRFYYDLESEGILADEDRRQEVIKKYKDKQKALQDKLNDYIGYEINVDSPAQVCNLLYNELKLPKRTRRRAKGHSTLTADEKAVMTLIQNSAKTEKQRTVLESIMSIRGCTKTLGTYLGCPKPTKGKKKHQVFFADADGRVRTSVFITGADTGRTSNTKIGPPDRAEIYGLAFQTITKHSEEGDDIRSIFISKPGYSLVEADQSQAESRIALLLAEEYELLKKMDELDIHTLTASWISGITYEEQLALHDDKQRQIGKHSGHAFDNGVGKKRLAELVYHHSDGQIVISEWKAGQILQVLARYKPGIQNVFHREIQDVLNSTRTLVDPWGGKRTFFDRLDEELYKQAYAHIKQKIVTGLTQKTGHSLAAKGLQAIYEGHDALMFEIKDEELEEKCELITTEFQRPIDFSRCSLPRGILVIPCEIKVGKRWSELKKIKLGVKI